MRNAERKMAYKMYKTLGVLIVRSAPSDLEEYTDLFRMAWDDVAMRWDLRYKVLPNGLLLRSPDGKPMVIYDNRLLRLNSELKIEGK